MLYDPIDVRISVSSKRQVDFAPSMSIATQQTYVLEFVKCWQHRG